MQSQSTLFDAAEQAEEFRDVAGWPGYRVGSFGTVWSRWNRGARRACDTWRQLKPVLEKDGRLQVTLCHNGKRRRFRVHHLIPEAFIGPCPDGQEACHDPDRDTTNNRVDNLRWDTKKGNAADKIKHGTTNQGERHGLAKLTDSDVLEIRQLYTTGDYTQSDLAAMFKVSVATINNIVHNNRWKHLTPSI